jgi:hypothetical protein
VSRAHELAQTVRDKGFDAIGHKMQHAGWIVSGDDFIEKVEHVPDGCAKCEAHDALAELERLAADAERYRQGSSPPREGV